MKLLRNTWWTSLPGNPILPPVAGSAYDSRCCMNPWALQHEGEYRLYYGGGDDQEQRAICLATAPIDASSGEPGPWERHGPLIDHGGPGSFDERWCVLPHVIRRDDGRWFLYYTGNNGRGEGLGQFPGLGVAISEDGKTFHKYEGNPIIERTGVEGDPDALGIAGGSVLQVELPDGTHQWRYYYTGCPTFGSDVFLHQQKTICLAVSEDGLKWEKRGAVMLRRPEVDYENVAVAGPVVHQNEDGTYRMWYSAIGTRWGYYSIGYAESADGLTWNRGTQYGDNLQLGPSWKRGGWEAQMVEYPSVVDEGGGKLRLFYCGNGYGRAGIGTATNTALRATRDTHGAHVVESNTGSAWQLLLPQHLLAGETNLWSAEAMPLAWSGPDADGAIWHEVVTESGLQLRAIVAHRQEGLSLTLTLHNPLASPSAQSLPAVRALIEIQPLNGSALPLNVEWDNAEGNTCEGKEVSFGDLVPGATVTRQVRVLPAA